MERIETASQRGRRVKRETLKAVLEQCQRALQSLDNSSYHDDGGDDDDDDVKAGEDEEGFSGSSSTCCPDPHADEICVLIKSRVEGREFMEKMESAQQSIPFPGTAEEGSCWDMVSDGDIDVDQDDYVVVQQEDIVDAIACFMAAYLFSLKHTKELTPDQLQQALGKTFSIKKRKGKLQKALDGSKAIYNVASWSATAVGIYQNPALLRAASTAFWTSCRVLSRLF